MIRVTKLATGDVPAKERATRSASRVRRLLAKAAEEIGHVRPRLRMARSLSALLPQFSFNRLRTTLYRVAEVRVGKGSLIMGDLIMSGSADPSLLSIGEHTYISGPLRVDLGASVRIGNQVNIGHDCLFLTVSHEMGPASRRAAWPVSSPIVIEDGVWVAARVTILPGNTIGEGAVIAAGAVVASDVPPNTLFGGVPARWIRDLS